MYKSAVFRPPALLLCSAARPFYSLWSYIFHPLTDAEVGAGAAGGLFAVCLRARGAVLLCVTSWVSQQN